MTNNTYDRAAAVEYANKWAYGRNPDFTDFSSMGGDCTNFASQCILAGAHGVMNFTPTYGWFYRSINNRTASWTGVQYLYNFLTTNQGIGPFASETTIREIRPGDIAQLRISGNVFHHSPVVVEVKNDNPTLDDVLVAAHSYDVNCKPLSSYNPRQVRFLHIEGVRVQE